jgi:putative tricarboxylic transport membrane protein
MMEIINLIPPMIMGMIAGIVTGMLPGPSAVTAIVVSYAWLAKLDALSLLVFYFALVNTVQYFASISATVYGVMGDITSQPAVTHGHRLFLRGQGLDALVGSSTASFAAAVLSTISFVLLFVWGQPIITWLLKDWVFFVMVLASLAGLIMATGRWITATVVCVLGAVLGKVGYDPVLQQRILTMGIDQLDPGIPILPLAMGLVTVPVIIDQLRNRNVATKQDLSFDLKSRWLAMLRLPQWWPVMRGWIMGFLLGLIPGGAASSSNLAAKLESSQPRSSDLQVLLAAESANNAASVSVLIPMLLFAVPLLTSEAMILELAQNRGLINATALDFLSSNIVIIVVMLTLINLLNWIISGCYFHVCVKIYQKYQPHIYWSALAVCAASLLMLASQHNAILLYLSVFFSAGLVSVIIKHESLRFILLFSYLTVTVIFDHVYRIIS